jgi:hypothetical protein
MNKKFWEKLREGGDTDRKQSELISLLHTPQTAYKMKKLGGDRQTERQSHKSPNKN